MKLNIFALSLAERNKRLKFHCVHWHNGISHPNCYDQANGLTERIGYWDLETSNLNADFGIILSYCILSDDNKLYSGLIKPEDIKSGKFDKPLLKQFCKDVRNFDRLIGWYSSRFDGPFARTRCIFHKLDFPLYKEIKHTDAWKFARNNLKMHSNRLGVIAPFFGVEAKGHPLNPEIWLKCLSGNQDALNFVLTHNKEDVYSLKKVWKKFTDYRQYDKKSL